MLYYILLYFITIYLVYLILFYYTLLIREAENNTKLWTLSKQGEGFSGTAKPFIKNRYGHVMGEGGGCVWLKVLVQSSFLQKSMYSRSMKSFFVLNWSTCFKTYEVPTQALSEKKSLFDWSEIGFIISNFTLGGEVRTKSEHPNFLRPYLPRGGGHRSFGQCPKFFFYGFP